MAQRKKTPKLLVELINKFDEYVAYAEERIRVKTTLPVENQAQHIRDISLDEIAGQVTGAYVMLENALFAYGCYAGYMHVGPAVPLEGGGTRRDGHVRRDSPDYIEWRRTYFTNV